MEKYISREIRVIIVYIAVENARYSHLPNIVYCRSFSFCQNSSVVSRHRRLHKTSECVLWYLTLTTVQQVDQICWSRTSHGCSNLIDIWGIWRPRKHFEVFVMFLKPLLKNICSVAGCIILLKEATAIREHSELERGLQQSLGLYVSKTHSYECKVSKQNIAQSKPLPSPARQRILLPSLSR